MLRDWEKLPVYMRTKEVKPYYDHLKQKRNSLLLKRIFDFSVSMIMLVLLAPVFLILSILIMKDSKGGVFYRQERVTQYGRKFKISRSKRTS